MTSQGPFLALAECLRERRYELEQVRWVVRSLLVELATVPTKDEEMNGSPQGMDRAREAARLASQASEIVTQFGVVRFDRIGLALVGHGEVDAPIEGQVLIGGQSVGIVPVRLWRVISQFLKQIITDSKSDPTADDAACGAVHEGHDEGFVFLSSMKVCSSSISMVSTSSGRGTGGNRAA